MCNMQLLAGVIVNWLFQSGGQGTNPMHPTSVVLRRFAKFMCGVYFFTCSTSRTRQAQQFRLGLENQT